MEKLSLLKMVCINFVFCAATVIASPAQTFTTLAVFNPPVTGWQPHYMSLIQGTDGNFYGTTFYGGNGAYCSEYQNGCGTVFKITSAGTLNALHSFCTQTSCPDCPDGSFPIGGLVQGADGDFHGTTSSGGTSSNCSGGRGTVFRSAPKRAALTAPTAPFPSEGWFKAPTGTSTGRPHRVGRAATVAVVVGRSSKSPQQAR